MTKILSGLSRSERLTVVIMPYVVLTNDIIEIKADIKVFPRVWHKASALIAFDFNLAIKYRKYFHTS